MYVLLVFIVNYRMAAEEAAALVYVIALCFVSSALGRLGADLQISSHAHLFHRASPVKAASLFYVCILVGIVLVPTFALIIHNLVGQFSTGQSPKVGSVTIVLSAVFFATGQNVATALQTLGHPLLPNIIFPFAPYVILVAVTAWDPALLGPAIPVAFAIPTLGGLLYCWKNLPFVPKWLSFRWMRQTVHYYIMELNHALSPWLPFTYLHMLLGAQDIVLLNLATRLSAIQSMPSNAVGAWLGPQFALNFRNGDTRAIEMIMQKAILISALFQIAYLAALTLAFMLDKRLMVWHLDDLILLLIILSIGQIVNGLTGPVGPALLMAGNKELMARASWIMLSVSTVAGIVLAKLGGVVAFAIGISLTAIVHNILYAYFLYRRGGISIPRLLIGIVTKNK